MSLADLLNYTFTGNATGTALQSVALEVGGAWSKVGNKSASDVRTTSAGRIANFVSSSNDSVYVAAALASMSDAEISATFTTLGTATTAAIGLRCDVTTYNAIIGGRDAAISSRPTIWKGITPVANGSLTAVDGQVYRLAVKTVGSSALYTLYVDGVVACSYTDTSPPPAGKPCVYFYSPTTSDDTHGTHLDNVRVTDLTPTSPTLVITNGLSSISLAMGISGTGGSGTYATIDLYRSTSPTDTATLLAANVTLPYVDTTVVAGVPYYYRLLVTDTHGNTVWSTMPLSGIGTAINSVGALVAPVPAYSSGRTLTGVNLIAIGDSNYEGVRCNNPTTDAPPIIMRALLAAVSSVGVAVSNRGASGTSVTEWQPGSGSLNAAALASDPTSAASVLHAANPTWAMVFSILLGTNDSAVLGYAYGNKSKADYKRGLAAIVESILANWPDGFVVLHYPTYLTPNAVTAYTYNEASLLLIQQYHAAIDELIAAYAVTRPGQVIAGDRLAYAWSAANWATSAMSAESGSNGLYRIHFTTTGSARLAAYQAAAIYNGLARYGRLETDAVTLPTTPPDGYGGTSTVGTGNRHVNQDTGGTDNLAFKTAGNIGIDEAQVTAYLKADYDAGDRTVRGQVFTTTDGAWAEDMMLNAGTYRFVFEKSGYQAVSVEQAVV